MPRDRCKNCGRSTPGRWMCDTCAPYFDGERFLATPEELGIDTDDDEEKVYQNFVWVTDFNHPRTTMFIKDMSLSQLRSIRANLHPNDRISPDVFDYAIKRREFDEDDGA